MQKLRKIVLSCLCFLGLLVSFVYSAVEDIGGITRNRTFITFEELSGEIRWDEKPVQDLSSFMATGKWTSARHEFNGTLQLSTSEMLTDPTVLSCRYPFNVIPVDVPVLYDSADAKLFPGLAIRFFTYEDHLVPVSRDVIRPPLAERTASFWDIVVEPGRVWAEESDEGWSRAAFPFALVSSLDGDTRNGIATFLFNDNQVSDLRYQIVQQTQPYMQNDYFTAWGQMSVSYRLETIGEIEVLKIAYLIEKENRYTAADWSTLEEKYGKIDNFESGTNMSGHITSAIVVDKVLYYKQAKTPFGEYPFTPHMRFGVWSVSKTLTCGLAMLRLAEKYGVSVFDEKILDYFDESENNSGHDGWEDVTFGDCLDMATGLGSETGYWTRPDVDNWYYACTSEDKMKHIFTEENFSWGPGEKFVYNDEDMWILGVAMDRYLKLKEGPKASVLDMLDREVFEPIHVYHFCTTTTYTKDGVSRGTPNYAWGCLPTLDDLAKISTLLHNRGKLDGVQILHEDLCKQLFLEKDKRPRSSYMMSVWYTDYIDADKNRYKIPYMSGMGGNLVVLMPNGCTGIQLNKFGGGTSGMIAVADRLKPFTEQITTEVGESCEESNDNSSLLNLEQNYPNPFNPSTTIRFFTPALLEVDLAVFNVMGEKIVTLVDADISLGWHTIHFNADNLPSGCYFCRLNIGAHCKTRKIQRIK